MRVTIDSVLVRDTESVGADLDGISVLLSLRAGAYFNLNAVASEIWQMLAEPRRVSEIFASLGDGYSVDVQTVTDDVTPFLQSLVDHRLVRVVESQLKP